MTMLILRPTTTKITIASLFAVFCNLATSSGLAQSTTLNIYPYEWVGIQQSSPNVSSTQLRYRLNAASA
jgi:hypothetical protein